MTGNELIERYMSLTKEHKEEIDDQILELLNDQAMSEESEIDGKVHLTEDENDSLDDLTVDDQEPESMRAVG